MHEGEVESLTEASERGVGVRAWVGHRTGYAYGTDLSDAGLPSSPQAAVGAARVADADQTRRRRIRPADPGRDQGLRDRGLGTGRPQR